MTALRDQLHVSIEILKQGQYSRAVLSLEAFIQQAKPDSKPYLQAQMHLVQAYQGNGQYARASSLCRILATSQNLRVQRWAQQTIEALLQDHSTPVTLTSAARIPAPKNVPSIKPKGCGLKESAAAGIPAPQNISPQRQPKSLHSLKLQGTQAFLQTKRRLLDVYLENGQSDRAISLCLTLATSNNPNVQQWAQRAIKKLSSPPALPPAPASASSLSHLQTPSPVDSCAQPNRYFANYLEGTAMEKVVSQIRRKDTVIL
jgi:HEAT repeat protein